MSLLAPSPPTTKVRRQSPLNPSKPPFWWLILVLETELSRRSSSTNQSGTSTPSMGFGNRMAGCCRGEPLVFALPEAMASSVQSRRKNLHPRNARKEYADPRGIYRKSSPTSKDAIPRPPTRPQFLHLRNKRAPPGSERTRCSSAPVRSCSFSMGARPGGV